MKDSLAAGTAAQASTDSSFHGARNLSGRKSKHKYFMLHENSDTKENIRKLSEAKVLLQHSRGPA